MKDNAVLEMRNIHKSFPGVKALQGVDFTLRKGEVHALMGENGAGKSTLMNLIGGIDRPTSGNVMIDGKKIFDMSESALAIFMRRNIGIVYQFYNLIPNLTVDENIMLPCLLDNRKPDPQKLSKIVELTGLSQRRGHLPGELSGGQKRRAALAGVLAMEPKVLVLDEPTAGLDPAGRENLMANIREYHRHKNATILLVSHSMDEIAQNVDRILVLKSAHILMSGTPAEVFTRAEELLSAGLDVPQITRVAMALRDRGVPIDPAVYTVEDLERQLLALRRGGAPC